MERQLAELERLQTQILQRISKLELSFSPQELSASLPVPDSSQPAICDTETRLSGILRTNGVNDFSFKKVLSDYYDWPLEARRDAVGAVTIEHLCKSIVLVNALVLSQINSSALICS